MDILRARSPTGSLDFHARLWRAAVPCGRITIVVLQREGSGEGGPPTHVHDAREEYFYVASGEATFFVGDTTIAARAGDTAVVPRGTPHRFVGTADLRMVLVVSPPGLDGYFRELMNGADRAELSTRYDSRVV